MGQVRYTAAAQTDLLEAWVQIAEENPDAADRVLDKISNDIENLITYPAMGRTRPDLGGNLRSWVTTSRYSVFYVIEESDIVVIRILHHARDIDLILSDC